MCQTNASHLGQIIERGNFMKTKAATPAMRELSDKELVVATGGVLGAISGYTAPVPSILFPNPTGICMGVPGQGGTCYFSLSGDTW
jgi:hypothetical protein